MTGGRRVPDLLIALARRRLPAAAGPILVVGVVVVLLLGIGGAGSQTPPAAPTITSVTSGDGALTVVWAAPTGVSGITRYDLRYIRTDAEAADKADDSKWMEQLDVWSSGDPLEFIIGGLVGRVSYDVQVRLVNSDGLSDWSSTSTGIPGDPPPVIGGVVEGDQALTVYWRVPLGVDAADVTAYDLRLIETDATDKADVNWNEFDDVWTPDAGPLRILVTGLSNDTSYDVQVRAVTTGDGPWSPTTTGTPAEPGESRSAATSFLLGTRIGGVIEPGTDADYFRITLSERTGVMIFTEADWIL